MIKQIVKRNGQLEDFAPEKINGWGEWAATALDGLVDWSMIVTHTVASLPETCDSQTLQERLIRSCLDQNGWSYYLMAGRLYAAYLRKKIHNGTIPTVRYVHERLIDAGLMVKLDYDDKDYDEVEYFIRHDRDFTTPHFSLDIIRKKYSLQNTITGEEFETQQFVYMRMAMALAESEPRNRRMHEVREWYNRLSRKIINAPTPNFVNLGTPLRGYASCCTYTTHDSADSLAVGDHIAYMMTVMSAGIGSHVNTRSVGDPVRNGIIKHQGRLPYYRSLVGAVKANLQNGRGGAVTTFYSCFDPEAEVIAQLKNPMSTEDKKIRGMDYTLTINKFFARKVAKKEKVFTFNSFTAPDLYAAFYSSDSVRFEELYNHYEQDPTFTKNYIDARELLLVALNEAYETGRAYLWWVDEANTHTPFEETIHSSNLCLEIDLPTTGYENMMDLYSTEDHGRGEIGLCSLGGVVITNIDSDEEYYKSMYYTLKMIDRTIDMAEYKLPHLGVTAKARRSAGIGIMDLAHHMARKGLSYASREGKAELHRVAERHMYFAIKASLQLAKEYGVAPWMHKTKWPKGWLPIDTYNKNVDKITDQELIYDWETLRKEVIANGGIRNSVLVAYMPGESSSKSSGTTNAIYPIREATLNKTDNNTNIYWAAPNSDTLYYESAWDVHTLDLIEMYAIFQKFTDQGISADLYRKLVGDEMVTTDEMLENFFAMTRYGLKSRYYQNSYTSNQNRKTADKPSLTSLSMSYSWNNPTAANETPLSSDNEDNEVGCAGGFCTL